MLHLTDPAIWVAVLSWWLSGFAMGWIMKGMWRHVSYFKQKKDRL